MPAYHLISVTEGEGIKRRLDTPLVGRDVELKVLTDALERTRAHRRAEVVTVVGPAGVGKSRLLHELLIQGGDEKQKPLYGEVERLLMEMEASAQVHTY